MDIELMIEQLFDVTQQMLLYFEGLMIATKRDMVKGLVDMSEPQRNREMEYFNGGRDMPSKEFQAVLDVILAKDGFDPNFQFLPDINSVIEMCVSSTRDRRVFNLVHEYYDRYHEKRREYQSMVSDFYCHLMRGAQNYK